MKKKVVILGGGIAGLLSAIQLAKAGIQCHLFEKKAYPFHRVCGEYVSNEAMPFLLSIGAFPSLFDPPAINRLMLSSVSGRFETMALDLGGFGISRYSFDQFLYEKAREAGASAALNETVEHVAFSGQQFHVSTRDATVEADVVIGSFGKRSNLDLRLQRRFTQERSPYLGVKYHIRYDHPEDLIALHNFPGGYCGISKVENGKVNLCYLVHRGKLKAHKNIPALEKAVLFQNPFIRKIFEEAVFLFEKPETINEISFDTKDPVDAHMLMVGDAAGMITPLCGNGMAMAIHASMIASALVKRFCLEENYTREQLEYDYTAQWKRAFRWRLWAGRQIQRLFGSEYASSFAVRLAVYFPAIATALIRRTHGQPF